MITMLSLSSVSSVEPQGQLNILYKGPNLCLQFEHAGEGLTCLVNLGKVSEPLMQFPLCRNTECCRYGKIGYVIVVDNDSKCFIFADEVDAHEFHRIICRIRDGSYSVFTERTDESSASQYFQFYGYLSQQQNMLQDFIRTSTYQKAIISNYTDFQDKVVLDVGAGSGILSFFAAQAGARRVYAVEASSMANHARVLVNSNGLDHVITVVAGKIEELILPEKVDVIVSEPMGYMLINERMLETYLHAKKFLKPGGKMFPCQGDLHIAPFQDEALYTEQFNKSSFWYQNAFHNVDLRCLRQAAQTEYFGQPIVDTFDIRICTAKSVKHSFDFLTADESSLHNIEIPLHFEMIEGGSIHGLAFWFDVLFSGTLKNIWLSTCPTEPLTHWYQVRCLLENPLFVNAGDIVTGFVKLLANKRQSYDVTLQLQKVGTDMISTNTLDLKNPNFRYTGTAVAAPPGANTSSPSDMWWASMDEHVSIVNGGVQTVQLPVNGDVQTDGQPMQVQSVQPAAYGPIIHPGSISSTGRQRVGSLTPTSTQQAQLIGGGISPTLFTSSSSSSSGTTSGANSTGSGQGTAANLSRHLVSHYPVSNNLMIGDYVATGIPLHVSATGRQ